MDIPGRGQLSLGLPRGFKNLEASESQIETSICHYLHVKGYFFWKQPMRGYFSGKVSGKDSRGHSVMVGHFRKDVNPYVRPGIPDIIMVKNGQFIGFEVKSKKGIQSETQVSFQGDLERAGGKYFIVRSIEDVETVLKGI